MNPRQPRESTVVAASVTAAGPHRFLHVANGTCTTRLLGAAGIAGTHSIWADPLYEGPVPGGLTDEALLDLRARFHGGPASDMRQWRATIADHVSYDELVLWFEHDLFDQLNLIQLLAWIRDHLPTSTPVSLICIGVFPGRPDFKGLGELTPPELASLFDTRRPLGDIDWDLARRAWQAFRAPSPEPLDALRHTDTAALPYLAPAIARFLQEYPWTRDGLSRSERRLMELARDGSGVALARAFGGMHDGEQAYYMTDRSLAALADDLCRTSPPLLRRSTLPDSATPELRGSVTLTEAGHAVLAGRLDRIGVCGIDRWLGGVHLEQGAPLWRWDETAQRIISA